MMKLLTILKDKRKKLAKAIIYYFWNFLKFSKSTTRPKIRNKMISFEEYKKALGEHASKYTDQELDQARKIQDVIADILFTSWPKKSNNIENNE